MCIICQFILIQRHFSRVKVDVKKINGLVKIRYIQTSYFKQLYRFFYTIPVYDFLLWNDLFQTRMILSSLELFWNDSFQSGMNHSRLNYQFMANGEYLGNKKR